MNKSVVILLLIFHGICFSQQKEDTKTNARDNELELNDVVEKWHKAAAEANYKAYFNLMDEHSIFIGTDPTENWNYDEFKAYAKPYFDKGKAWSFTTLERNVFTENNSTLAWFDELLDTRTGICRGSGVLQKTENGWKIKHYVLSITIPNENAKEITTIKSVFDTDLIKKLKTKKKIN